MEEKLAEQRKQRQEEERKAGVKKDIAAHEKESETARERLERLLSNSEQQRQQTDLKKSIAPLQKSPVLQQLDAMARGENPTAAGPSTSSPGPDLRGLQGGGVFQLKPSANALEQRTIGATAPPSTSTFTCGTPPNQYPCPVSVDQREASPPLTSTTSAAPQDDLGPFTPNSGAREVAPDPRARQPTPRQEEHARREQQRRAEEADATIAKAIRKNMESAAKLDCPWWKNVGSCQTPSGFPGRTCRWCTNGDCDDNWFCQ